MNVVFFEACAEGARSGCTASISFRRSDFRNAACDMSGLFCVKREIDEVELTVFRRYILGEEYAGGRRGRMAR